MTLWIVTVQATMRHRAVVEAETREDAERQALGLAGWLADDVDAEVAEIERYERAD